MSTSLSNIDLDLCRYLSSDDGIRGKILLNHIYICDCVEPPYRPKYGAINQGEYDVVMVWSSKFKREVPLVIGVPGRSGIEFHSGNVPLRDSRGCILPGYIVADKTMVQGSRIAMDILCSNLAQAKEIHLTVYDMFV